MSDYTPIGPRPEDLKALVEACLMDGFGFGKITKEIRTEWPSVGLREAISRAMNALLAIQADGGAIGSAARYTLNEWTVNHPGIPIHTKP